MTYEESLRFWYAHVNYEQRSATPADLKLDHMKLFLSRLGDPHRRLRIVHVAGSKGKGSTSAMLAAVLRAAGYRTGLFTSPHLCRVDERIQVDGQSISPAELAALMSDVAAVIREDEERGQAAPTFFEIASALGFLHFLRRRVDIAVVEVGLGGRFDSTNVCLPEVSVITSISLDHTKQLGNKLCSIASEKAGIIKTGRPVISGVLTPEAKSVIEDIARERKSPLRQLCRDFHFKYQPGKPALGCRAKIQISSGRHTWPTMELGLMGEHQAANASVAVATVEQLRASGWHIPDDAVRKGLANVEWPARMEVMGRSPWLILDCAHNVASAEALIRTLRESFPSRERHLIFASSKDKDVAGMFRVFDAHFQRAYLTQFADNPRSFTPGRLAEIWQANTDVKCSIHDLAEDALRTALAQAGPDSLVCITGSVFLAGELRSVVAKMLAATRL